MAESYSNDTPRTRILKRKAALWKERSTWDSHIKDISKVLLPMSGRFFESDRNDGRKRFNNIFDSTATKSLNVMAAGLMAGMTSPARPWFRLATSDSDLMEYEPVKIWLDDVTMLMREVFSRSNTYRSLHSIYLELGAFGTASSIVMPDYDNIVHHHPLTFGEYAISTNARGRVDTMYREFQMTVSQIVGEFGIDNVSHTVKNMWDNRNYDTWVTVVHAIEPRTNRDNGKMDDKNMPFKSCYIEAGKDDYEKYLRESGFKNFKVLAPRWNVSGGDIYGSSPGMESLGDIRQLQHQQLRKGQAIDYQVNPPLQVPTSLKNQGADRLPGGIIYTDQTVQGGGIRSVYEVNLNLQYLLEDIRDVRERIRGTFYADLFMMLANDNRSGITATEVAERHEEKLLMLGPVLERLHNELLNPLIDLTFEQLVEADVLPPIPPELEGIDLKVEFVSMLAQAQRAVGINSIDRLLTTVGGMASMKPDILDKINFDQVVDDYSDMLGVSPSLIVSDDNVAVMREQRAAQAQQAQQIAMMQPMVDMAKTASDINPDVIDQFSGYSGIPL